MLSREVSVHSDLTLLAGIQASNERKLSHNQKRELVPFYQQPPELWLQYQEARCVAHQVPLQLEETEVEHWTWNPGPSWGSKVCKIGRF